MAKVKPPVSPYQINNRYSYKGRKYEKPTLKKGAWVVTQKAPSEFVDISLGDEVFISPVVYSKDADKTLLNPPFLCLVYNKTKDTNQTYILFCEESYGTEPAFVSSATFKYFKIAENEELFNALKKSYDAQEYNQILEDWGHLIKEYRQYKQNTAESVILRGNSNMSAPKIRRLAVKNVFHDIIPFPCNSWLYPVIRIYEEIEHREEHYQCACFYNTISAEYIARIEWKKLMVLIEIKGNIIPFPAVYLSKYENQ